MKRDFPLSPTPPIVTDSIDVAKAKSGYFAKKYFSSKDFMDNFSRKDFMDKNTALMDSADKYSDIVFNSARKMNKKNLANKGIIRNITSKGDTTYKYNSKGVNFKNTFGKTK
jgi:hypothetical protein